MKQPPLGLRPYPPCLARGAPAAAGQSPFRAGCWVRELGVMLPIRRGYIPSDPRQRPTRKPMIKHADEC